MKTARHFDFSGKKVLMRLDVNVPMKDGKVLDDFRIVHALPTITHVLKKCDKLILMSHAGRPEGKVVEELSLKPIGERIGELLGEKVTLVKDYLTNDLPDDKLILLENLRFHDEEKKNDKKFAERLASFADIFVNEAFAVCHREHASVVGVAKILPGCIGYGVEKELKYLNMENPKEPVVAILGGAKLETKIPVIKNLLPKVEKILIGGAMIFTFYKAEGLKIGKSMLDEEYLAEAKTLLGNKKLFLPTDVVIADSTESTSGENVSIDKIPDDKIGLDIGEESLKKFKEILSKAKTIIWNGPLGFNENEAFAKATNDIIEFLSELDATTIIGGGDTAGVVNKLGLAEKFTHVSTGGGASMKLLGGSKLVGLEALKE